MKKLLTFIAVLVAALISTASAEATPDQSFSNSGTISTCASTYVNMGLYSTGFSPNQLDGTAIVDCTNTTVSDIKVDLSYQTKLENANTWVNTNSAGYDCTSGWVHRSPQAPLSVSFTCSNYVMGSFTGCSPCTDYRVRISTSVIRNGNQSDNNLATPYTASGWSAVFH